VITDSISEETLREYYDKNIEMYRVEKVRAKHILFLTVDENEFPYPDAVKESIKTDANNILIEILDGHLDFDVAMRKYSKDPGLKANPDGYLFTRGEMLKAFEDAAFDTEPGRVYPKLAESEIGYHIVKTLDKVTVYTPFENVKDSIYNALRNDVYTELITPLIDEAEIIINTSVYENI
jgi:parvulin-like peptidyl-prolyl isomerase